MNRLNTRLFNWWYTQVQLLTGISYVSVTNGASVRTKQPPRSSLSSPQPSRLRLNNINHRINQSVNHQLHTDNELLAIRDSSPWQTLSSLDLMRQNCPSTILTHPKICCHPTSLSLGDLLLVSSTNPNIYTHTMNT